MSKSKKNGNQLSSVPQDTADKVESANLSSTPQKSSEKDAINIPNKQSLVYVCDYCGKSNAIDAPVCTRCGKRRPRHEYVKAMNVALEAEKLEKITSNKENNKTKKNEIDEELNKEKASNENKNKGKSQKSTASQAGTDKARNQKNKATDKKTTKKSIENPKNQEDTTQVEAKEQEKKDDKTNLDISTQKKQQTEKKEKQVGKKEESKEEKKESTSPVGEREADKKKKEEAVKEKTREEKVEEKGEEKTEKEKVEEKEEEKREKERAEEREEEKVEKEKAEEKEFNTIIDKIVAEEKEKILNQAANELVAESIRGYEGVNIEQIEDKEAVLDAEKTAARKAVLQIIEAEKAANDALKRNKEALTKATLGRVELETEVAKKKASDQYLRERQQIQQATKRLHAERESIKRLLEEKKIMGNPHIIPSSTPMGLMPSNQQVTQPFTIVPYVNSKQPLLQYRPNQLYRFVPNTPNKESVQGNESEDQ